MTPKELQLLKKQNEEITNRIQKAEKLLYDMSQLKALKEQVNNGNYFQLLINEDTFYLEYLGLKTENIKKMFIEIIDKQYDEYMNEWEVLQ